MKDAIFVGFPTLLVGVPLVRLLLAACGLWMPDGAEWTVMVVAVFVGAALLSGLRGEGGK